MYRPQISSRKDNIMSSSVGVTEQSFGNGPPQVSPPAFEGDSRGGAVKPSQILGSIGISEKRGQGYRGFRGIGRLGGLAFSKRVTFKTKAKGELVETIQEWDCEKLRIALQDPNKQKNSIRKLYYSSAKIYQKNTKNNYISIIKQESIKTNKRQKKNNCI